MKDRIQELATTIWELLTDEERMDWACDDGMYNFVEAVAALICAKQEWLDLPEQDKDDIVDAVYEER